MLERGGDNYFTNNTTMTAFYRETIKKRRTNASLSEAVIEIQKQAYNNKKRDAVSVVKVRKNTKSPTFPEATRKARKGKMKGRKRTVPIRLTRKTGTN